MTREKRQKKPSGEGATERLFVYDRILKEACGLSEAIRRTQEVLPGGREVSLYLRTMVPALFSFTDWVLWEAARSGVKRLYFLSRDGYPMYRIACFLARQRRLTVECRYLFVSRHAMRVPAYGLDLEHCLDLICVGGIDVTPEKLLRRAALTMQEREEILLDTGLWKRRGEILDYRQILEVKKILKAQEKLFDYIRRHSQKAYENAMGYLAQEGLLSDVPYALVDSGWVGTQQRTLEKLIQSRRPRLCVKGYYFGLYELPKGADRERFQSWYFSPEKGLRRKIYFSNSLFEAICSSPEGTTLGYLKKEGRFLPVLAPQGNPNRARLKRNLRALETFLEYCPDSAKGPDGRLTERLFETLMACPGSLETECFGTYLFSDDPLEGSMRQAAARLKEREIRRQRLLRRLCRLFVRGKSAIRESGWIEGSVAYLAPKKRGRYLRHVRFYKGAVYFKKQFRAVLREKTQF